MKKVVIVMTYFERQHQLNQTLKSFCNSSHKNFEVVIVDDSSKVDILVPDVPFPVTVLKTEGKVWTNPEPAYNVGFKAALAKNPDIVIIQNAECMHHGDVISYSLGASDVHYISFGCFSVDQYYTFNPIDVEIIIRANNRVITANGQNGWYNHPVYRPGGFDFCSAITANRLKELNGYDERFSSGCWYGDDYLLARIRMLGMEVEITTIPIVIHQWHYNGVGIPANLNALVEKNRQLFGQLVGEGNPKAVHLYTKDLT